MRTEMGQASGIVIRRDSGLPIYRQLVDQLRFLIGAGRFRTGEMLPTMRELSGELGLNLNTVNRAYRQLQRDGLIRSTPGKGASVVGGAAEGAPVVASTSVDAILAAAVERALAAGLTPRAIADRMDAILAGFEARVPPPPRIVVSAGRAWRSRRLAAGLHRAIEREVLAIEDEAPDAEPPDVVVLARYGGWCPDRAGLPSGASVVEVPVIPEREAVRLLVGLEPGGRVVIVAEDDGVARWLADAASAYAAPAATRYETGASLPADGEVAVVEAGAPAVEALEAARSGSVIVVAAAFPATIVADVERALGR
jgi:GntR family transcriptional regulator